MDKIKSLLERSGCKSELVISICEALETYKKTTEDRYKADYKVKIDEAKKVCLEETENHKRELSRRVQIFCETKAASIEAHLAKQSAALESQAISKLKKVGALVEGLNDGESAISTVVLEKAKKQLKTASEDKNRAIEKANRQTQIAEKLLSENRRLMSEVATLRRQASSPSTVVEGKQQTRLDTNRVKQSKAVTTRATITENNDLRPRQPAPRKSGNGFGIGEIADNMEELV